MDNEKFKELLNNGKFKDVKINNPTFTHESTTDRNAGSSEMKETLEVMNAEREQKEKIAKGIERRNFWISIIGLAVAVIALIRTW